MAIYRASLFLLLLTAGCTGGSTTVHEEPLGTVKLAALGEVHDVVEVRYGIAEVTDSCAGPFIEEKTMPIEAEPLDPVLGGGNAHRFSDALFVMPPGPYLACATPVRIGGYASTHCDAVSAQVNVQSQVTTEVVLISPCTVGASGGGLDVVVALNTAPTIDDIDADPGKFIETCESATITIDATDIDGDPISYAWSLAPPAGSTTATLTEAADSATLTPDIAGDYDVTVRATDVHGGFDEVTFTIHVDDGLCQSPGEVDWLQGAGSIQVDQTNAVATAPNGDAFFGGSYRGIGFGFGSALPMAGDQDGFIAKMAADGTVLWQLQVTSSFGNEDIIALETDSAGDLFVAGTFSHSVDIGCGLSSGTNDMLIAKLDGTDGSCLWSFAIGGNLKDIPYVMAVDSNDDLIVGGQFASTSINIPGGGFHTNTNQSQYDIIYFKRDGSDGSPIWDHAAGTVGQDHLYGLDVDANGDVFIGGHFGAPSITFDPAVTATYTLVGTVFVGKLHALTGNMSWVVTPVNGRDAGADLIDLAVDAANGVVVVGDNDGGPFDFGSGSVTSGNSGAIFVARFRGSDGAHDFTALGAESVNGANARGIAIDPVSDELRVSFDLFNGTIDFGDGPLGVVAGSRDVFMMSLSGFNGDERWHISGGGPAADFFAPRAIAVDATGNTFLGGYYGNGPTDFTIGTAPPISAAGSSDAFAVKLFP